MNTGSPVERIKRYVIGRIQQSGRLVLMDPVGTITAEAGGEVTRRQVEQAMAELLEDELISLKSGKSMGQVEIRLARGPDNHRR